MRSIVRPPIGFLCLIVALAVQITYLASPSIAWGNDSEGQFNTEDAPPFKSRSKTEWKIWLMARYNDYYNVKTANDADFGNYAKQIVRWRYFLTMAEQDNPFTLEDDELRRFAQDQIARLRKLESGEITEEPLSQEVVIDLSPKSSPGGRLHRNAAGVVTDSISGLQWVAFDNGKDISYLDAKKFIAELRIDGHDDWRIPTPAEANALFRTGPGYEQPNRRGFMLRVTDLVQLSSCCIWTSQTRREQAAYFDLHSGQMGWFKQTTRALMRALAVRGTLVEGYKDKVPQFYESMIDDAGVEE